MPMKRFGKFFAYAGLATLAAVAVAQTQQQKPTPTAEHKQLDFFVGKWTGEGKVMPNPVMPTGTYTSKDDCSWFEGNFAVICKGEGSGPMGQMKSLSIIGYSAEEKTYTYYGVDNSGMVMTTVSKGKLEGDAWTFTDEAMMGGKKITSRYTIKKLSPTSYAFKWEIQGPDGKWISTMEGTQKKS